MEMFWREKHPIANLNIKQLNNQRYSIMKKNLLSDQSGINSTYTGPCVLSTTLSTIKTGG